MSSERLGVGPSEGRTRGSIPATMSFGVACPQNARTPSATRSSKSAAATPSHASR